MSKERYPVIDTHFHVGVNTINTFIAEDDLIPWMDEAKIDIQIIFQVNEGFTHRTPEWNPYLGNDYVAKIQKMFPERVIGLATINPWHQAPKNYVFPLSKRGQSFNAVTTSPTLDEVERCIVDLGLWGLKMHPLEHGYAVNNADLIHPIMDRLTELQRKVDRRLMIVVHAMGDSLFNSPEAVADIATCYPDLLFLMAHSGFVWGYGTVARVVGPCENVMFDLTTCAQKSVVLEAYEKYGAQRFTAGTDGPFASPSVKMAIVEDVANSEEEKELILGGNLARYLGIPKNKRIEY